MQKKIIKLVFFTLFFSLFCLTNLSFVNAKILTDSKKEEWTVNTDYIASSSGYVVSEANNIDTLLGTVIKILLSGIGALFVLFIFLAGQKWMRASGNEEKISKAQKEITALVIGLIIIIAAYIASSWVITIFSK